LLACAEEVVIDLDRVPRQFLRLVRAVGHKEAPEPGEPALSAPIALASDHKGRVFVCDEALSAVFELDSAGIMRGGIWQKGAGPGDLSMPTAVVAHEGKILVAEGCFRVQLFDSALRFVDSYLLDWELAPFQGFGVLGNVVCIPFAPLPPCRTTIVHLYELGERRFTLIGSFFPYVKPHKRFSDPMGALLTWNRVRLATDGHQRLAIGRPHQAWVGVIDVVSRSAYKYRFTGAGITRRAEKQLGPGFPDFAAPELYDAIAFGPSGWLYVQFDFGVLEMAPGPGEERLLLVPETSGTKNEAIFPGATSMAVDSSRLFLAYARQGRLEIYQRSPGQAGPGSN